MKKLMITVLLAAMLPLAACTTVNDRFSNTIGRSEISQFECDRLYFIIDEEARPKADTTATGVNCKSNSQYSEGISGELGTLAASLFKTLFGWLPFM